MSVTHAKAQVMPSTHAIAQVVPFTDADVWHASAKVGCVLDADLEKPCTAQCLQTWTLHTTESC